MLQISNFLDTIAPGQRKIFYDEYNSQPLQCSDIFANEKCNYYQYPIRHTGGFGLWETATEGTPIAATDVKQGHGTNIQMVRFSKGYTITHELMEDDQQGVFSGTAGVGGSAKLLGSSLRATVETEAAKVLSSGFDNTGYDTKPLFAIDHKYHQNAISGVPTGSNFLDKAALSGDGIKSACKLMRSTMDNSGVAKVGAIPGQLIVHPDDEFDARSILYTGVNIAGTSISASTVPTLDLVVLDYLPDNKSYFVRAKNLTNLLLIWREEPTFGTQEVPQTMDLFCFGYTRFAASYGDWRGLVGVKKPV